MKKLVYAAALMITVAGCNNANEGKEKVKVMNMALRAPAERNYDVNQDKAVAQGPVQETVSRKIIKEGEISFETKNIAGTRKAIYNSVQKLDGYIAGEVESNDSVNTRNECLLKIRIPEKNFDLFLNNVSSKATRIDSKNIRARDVTSEYIDITTHLVNKKKLEDRYVDLLKKGNKMSDLLQIENKISEIETSIDSTQAQLNYLTKQVEYSSLDITFYTKQIVKNDDRTFGSKFINAISSGWADLGAFFFGCLAVWPLWLIGVIFYFISKAWLKKHPLKKTAAVVK
ncbi:DUF4349 domain-containing protein [Mucilaginibacter gotjawali]|uniref:DUF4349 domain-containing protein n=2 Tax=Mucilaginibacter gotjawali TaxID=1550579 RepID=A0A110B230_9SPHI|nr:DUF4349 domain-containing protein [Mucilaginibacter gotjawali]MBB3055489.1 hypothetical protein [Mucilaginibacter gotjawali]BAU53232.1 hypothetical protein MgSA37_01399 [Mucilaginibacter gotjawali]